MKKFLAALVCVVIVIALQGMHFVEHILKCFKNNEKTFKNIQTKNIFQLHQFTWKEQRQNLVDAKVDSWLKFQNS